VFSSCGARRKVFEGCQIDITGVMRDRVAHSKTLLPLLKATPALFLYDLFPASRALSPMTIRAIWGCIPINRAPAAIALTYFSNQQLA